MKTLFSYWTLVLSFFVSLPAFSSSSQSPYRIYIDAGSSGARLGIMRVDYEANGAFRVEELTDFTPKKSLGIHQLFGKAQADISAYVHELMDYAEKYLGMSLEKVPVHFYATAGMRLLSKEDQDQLLRQVVEALRTQHHCELIQARVITGQEEGMFGWYAVNSLIGALSDP